MSQTLPFLESYLLKITYYTVPEPTPITSDNDLHYETHIAVVRVINTGDKQLSESNLECLALSIPELHHRATAKSRAHALLHPVHLEVERLPWNSSAPIRPGAQLSSSSPTQPITLAAHQRSPTSAVASPATPPAQLPLQARPNADGGDWLKSDEWTTVTYKDQEYVRSFCSVDCAGDDGDVLGCCSVSDYTAYGQPVFSVYVDFLCEDRPAGNDPTSNSRKGPETKM